MKPAVGGEAEGFQRGEEEEGKKEEERRLQERERTWGRGGAHQKRAASLVKGTMPRKRMSNSVQR